MSGKLYIVPTPVGNLGDMTPRAVETLRNVDMILCEDTRTSGVLLKHFGITTPTASHHKYNEHDTTSRVVARLSGGENIALVSDAGTPGISDPGFMLVREARVAGIDVETLPGPTALIPALVNSGLPCDRFTFEGFLPPKKGRRTRLEELSVEPRTFVIYESPLRLCTTLKELAETCGPTRRAAVCREISKMYDSTHTGTLCELVEYFSANQPRGEIVIVIEGMAGSAPKKVHRNKYRDSSEASSDNL
ncbi:16S rRNA (cytidine(1402)-2'-O)-methyltransferase [Muribaculum intestinale]|uniref:16S rRNA (cytidine(1402)-2'-O)-methyltransferase n=1 Tax=Muribaculum intestinale TaxID=1796646 RepID=UPI0025A96320|nr:16S rRNA (cytidine(1402)-2'-O)-methyltransferase [Muribaculum intestinale]